MASSSQPDKKSKLSVPAASTPHSLLGELCSGKVCGPVVLVRLQCHTAGENGDNADPDSDYLSIPSDIQPSEWKTLLLLEEEKDKSAME